MTELLIMRDPHYDRMCFKSGKSSTILAENVEILCLYPIPVYRD